MFTQGGLSVPSIYDLKPRFQNLLRPLNASLVAMGFTANHVTLTALLLSLLLGVGIAMRPDLDGLLLLMPPWLFMRMALNAIDGMLAREHDMQSRLGAVLNEMGDVISDTALYLPLAWVAGLNATGVVLVVVTAIMVEMVGVVGVQIGVSRRYDGPFGKSDRAFGFGLLCLLLGLGLEPGIWSDGFVWVMFLLSLATLINRARQALAEAARQDTHV
jgi:CDP-diacylglycerol---glycerol-3-phosphate 3-phosphatidyltransferase